MHAENFVVNDSSESQIVENGGAVPPDVGRTILPEALIVEPVDLGDLSALVVASNQRDSLGVPDLEGQQEKEGLHTVVASVHEVAHE